MKNIHTSILILLSAILFSCENPTQTTINITVKNKTGVVQPNVIVYEFEYPDTDQFGSSPIYANKQRVTDNSGLAVFILDDYEYDTEKDENNLYFTVFNELTGSSYTTAGTVKVTFKKGDVISKELIIN